MLTVSRSSSDNNVISYVFPVLWMTSCFHIMELMGQVQSDVVMFGRVRQVAAPVGGLSALTGAKSAILVCHVHVQCVCCEYTYSIGALKRSS